MPTNGNHGHECGVCAHAMSPHAATKCSLCQRVCCLFCLAPARSVGAPLWCEDCANKQQVLEFQGRRRRPTGRRAGTARGTV